MPKTKKPSVEERFAKGILMLAGRGFNRAEAWELMSLLVPAWKGGIGLTGTQMDEIVDRILPE